MFSVKVIMADAVSQTWSTIFTSLHQVILAEWKGGIDPNYLHHQCRQLSRHISNRSNKYSCIYLMVSYLNCSRVTSMPWLCVSDYSGSDCLRTCGCFLMLLEFRCRPSQRTLFQMTRWTRTQRILTNACPVRQPFNSPHFFCIWRVASMDKSTDSRAGHFTNKL